jgi:hypothetical protein
LGAPVEDDATTAVVESLPLVAEVGVAGDGDGTAGVAESAKSFALGAASDFFGAGAAGFASLNASAGPVGGPLGAGVSLLEEAGVGGAAGCAVDATAFCAPGALGGESATSNASTCPLESIVVEWSAAMTVAAGLGAVVGSVAAVAAVGELAASGEFLTSCWSQKRGL